MTGPILAIETSCDETAAAVVEGRAILASVVASQADLHTPTSRITLSIGQSRHWFST
jgi:N6-L-threonylcarbamoyladenine synthase